MAEGMILLALSMRNFREVDEMIKYKKNIINLSKIVAFLLVCAILLHALSPIFVPKNNNKQSGIKYENARGFYGEKLQTIDILSLGNSDLYSAMNPLQLWKEQGYTSYVCAEPSQNIFSAYYLLKEVLKSQRPKLIILEVDELFTKSETDDIDEVINNTLKYAFPIFEYHSRWKSLQIKDIKHRGLKYNARMESKGYIFHNKVKSNPEGFRYMAKKRESHISETTKLYLKKLISYARENNAEVMFVWYPSATTATTTRHKSIQELSDQYDVPFVDFNMNQYDTKFDWSTDTRDGGNHLNYNGARKMTKYIGQYIQKNYQLTDHRNDPKFEQWNKDYESFMKLNKLS